MTVGLGDGVDDGDDGEGDGVRVDVRTVAGVEVPQSSGVAVAISRIVVSADPLHVRGCSPSAPGWAGSAVGAGSGGPAASASLVS